MDTANKRKKMDFETKCEQAAKALHDADILLLVTGAGWSAESGLAVYGDIGRVPAYQQRNLTYADVAQPHIVGKEPALFYGFWGQCFQDYRKTRPHEGYAIVSKWRDDKNSKEVAKKIRGKLAQLGCDSKTDALPTPHLRSRQ